MSGRDALPSRFRHAPKTQTSRSRRAFKPDGPGARVMAELGPYAYVSRLKMSDLDPSISDDPSGLYDHGVIAAAAAAAGRHYQGPFFIAFEVGHGNVYALDPGRLHAHVIAHRNDGPQHIPRDTERCKWVYDAPGLYRYLHKHDPFNLEALIDYTSACVLSPTGKTPRTRRHFFSAERSAWVVSHCTNDLTFPDPLPPILSCGRCRRRHLRHCRNHAAAAAFESHPDNRPDDRTPLPASDRPAAAATWEIPKLDPYSAAAAARAAEWEINTSYDIVPITKRDPPTTKLVIRRKGWVRRVLAYRRRAASYGLST